jgi:hypothetical protein
VGKNKFFHPTPQPKNLSKTLPYPTLQGDFREGRGHFMGRISLIRSGYKVKTENDDPAIPDTGLTRLVRSFLNLRDQIYYNGNMKTLQSAEQKLIME